ncbi:Six-hairpin glycosidase [Basidiobolus meristosporus CBS 931.73]|uniref:cellulase n=1 Tax=Basidiobolus meristosporus CBS 931.73 TaxID=1314790 RepID=A0A1Y1XM67_9FUNG|nr:Six-hairpin glycosidase [Basidiobolus meristosporus CBS 931.73]|eukprot:ORX86793.1 Six-hairpin glycosidase [Basidiobolus meristosporus CBS 931.73]
MKSTSIIPKHNLLIALLFLSAVTRSHCFNNSQIPNEVTTPIETEDPETKTPEAASNPQSGSDAKERNNTENIFPPPLRKYLVNGSLEYATYTRNLELALWFYDAQRSGKLPPANRVPWRKSSHMDDGKPFGLDLSGGYYDAGDFVKFALPAGYTLTTLSWGAIEYREGFVKAGQWGYLLDAIKWGTDYIIKSHVEETRFVVQVGDPFPDHNYWGTAENMPKQIPRPVYFVTPKLPGTEPVLESCAALAAASMVFTSSDDDALKGYGNTLLQHAISLHKLGTNNRGKYQNSVAKQTKNGMLGVREGYLSSGFEDELAWGTLWLYRATNNNTYLAQAESFYRTFALSKRLVGTFQSWDDKSVGVTILLAAITKKQLYFDVLYKYFDWISRQKTPGGLIWIPESSSGSNNVAISTALMSMLFADLCKASTPQKYTDLGKSQVDYILGKNPLKRNYIVGSDTNSPIRIHHAGSQGINGWGDYTSQKPNQFVLYGALVGGPKKDDSHSDVRTLHVENEPALDFNAPLVTVLARMAMFST